MNEITTTVTKKKNPHAKDSTKIKKKEKEKEPTEESDLNSSNNNSNNNIHSTNIAFNVAHRRTSLKRGEKKGVHARNTVLARNKDVLFYYGSGRIVKPEQS